ncbi:SufE family protein [Spirosoma foliorum]|uniref:SufE family protein n=1 Tax=Spirosoma foliorum TaxID=2710596 RepID=A0A7G5GVT7_9BACT|nr:SufE family protein [Spirosoma foliorum]QMW02979.1 SufE family protein [Spirosoma foliorum]
MTINEKQDEIIEEFDSLDNELKEVGFDLSERLLQKTDYIMDLGQKLPSMPESDKTEDNRIFGCQSVVWLTARMQDDKLYFSGDGDQYAKISKGIISLLIRALSGAKPEEIANANLYFIDKIGMQSFISSRRTGGLASMVERMKAYGREYSGQEA